MTDSTRLLAGALVRSALRGEPARATPHLLVRTVGGAEQAVALPAELTLGRGPGAGLRLADDGASRLHARIRLTEDGAAAVEDLGSKNGLTLNGRPLPAGPAALRSGDELRLGGTVICYQDPLAPPAGQQAPAVAAAVEIPARPPERADRWPGTPRPEALLGAAAGLLGLAALLLALG